MLVANVVSFLSCLLFELLKTLLISRLHQMAVPVSDLSVPEAIFQINGQRYPLKDVLRQTYLHDTAATDPITIVVLLNTSPCFKLIPAGGMHI